MRFREYIDGYEKDRLESGIIRGCGAASSLLLHLLPDQGVKRPLGDLFVTSKKLTNILSQTRHPFIISPDIQTSA